MSMKNVELQIAVPRTSEAGRYQSEYDFKRSSEQSLLASNEDKKAKRESKQSPKMADTEKTGIRNHSQSDDTVYAKKINHSEETAEEPARTLPAEHPFKGKHIDYFL